MIEQAMTFALGMLVAGLLALVSAPAFWRRAMRLSRRRLELQIPLSTSEILAERDHVRAEAALTVRRAEQKLEAAGEARTLDLAELGRRAVAIDSLERQRSALASEAASLSAELERHRLAGIESRAEAGALAQALHGVGALRDAAIARSLELERRNAELGRIAESRRGAIAALETRSQGLEMRVEDLSDTLQDARAAIEAVSKEAAALAEQRDFLAQELARSEQHRDKLQSRYEAQIERLQQLEREAADERAAARRAALEAGHHRDAAARQESRLADAEARIADLRRRHEETVQAERGRERALSDRSESLRSENAALQGALEAARAERDALRDEIVATRGRSGRRRAQDEGELRRLITQVADEVVRRAALEEGPGSPAHDWLAASSPPRRPRTSQRHAARLARAQRVEGSQADPATRG